MRPRVSFDPEFDEPVKSRKKARPKHRRLLEWLIFICVISPIVGCMLSPILTSPNFGKPRGRAIPDQLPDEANRVVNSQGFSLVIPPNWESWIGDSESFAMIGASPRELIPRRWSPRFAVERQPKDRATDLADFKPTVFQGKAAHERISTYPGNGDVVDPRPPLFTYVLIFQRDGAWYKMIYFVPDDRDSLPPIMLRYFNTFRVDHGA